MTVSHYIIALAGVGYLIVGLQQLWLSNIPGGIIWISYSASQVGLYMSLKTV